MPSASRIALYALSVAIGASLSPVSASPFALRALSEPTLFGRHVELPSSTPQLPNASSIAHQARALLEELTTILPAMDKGESSNGASWAFVNFQQLSLTLFSVDSEEYARRARALLEEVGTLIPFSKAKRGKKDDGDDEAYSQNDKNSGYSNDEYMQKFQSYSTKVKDSAQRFRMSSMLPPMSTVI